MTLTQNGEVSEADLLSITPGYEGKADIVFADVFTRDKDEAAGQGNGSWPAADVGVADFAARPPEAAAAETAGAVKLPTALLSLKTGSEAETGEGERPVARQRRRSVAVSAAERPPLIPDSRDPQLVQPSATEPDEPGAYRPFSFLDLTQPRTAEELVESGYHLGVVPWPDPAHLGWNPLMSDFGAGAEGEGYAARVAEYPDPAITLDMASRWAEKQEWAAHTNYANSLNLSYMRRQGWSSISGSNAKPKKLRIRTASGFDGSLSEGSGELFYDLPETHVSFCASKILGEVRPGLSGGKGRIGYYLGGVPGGGKTVMARQLAAHLGVPCVSLPLMPDERLTERIFYTETLNDGRTEAELTDVAYVYCVGGILQVDDAHHQDDLGYLSTLLDPNVDSITLKAADPELHGTTLVRHPGFRVVLTYNGSEHMKDVGLGTEIPSNIRDRMHQISNEWDGYEQIRAISAGHWTSNHRDPKVALYGATAIKVMDEMRARAEDLEAMPSMRFFDALLRDGSLYDSVVHAPLADPSEGRNWGVKMESFVGEMVRGAKDTYTKKVRQGGYDPLALATSSQVDQMFAELREHIVDTYGTLPGITAFGGDMTDLSGSAA